LCKFPKPWYIQKSNFIRKTIFSVTFSPFGLSAQFFFFFTSRFSLPFPLGLGLPAGPTHPHGPTATFLLPPAPKLSMHGAVAGRPHAASMVAPTPPPEEKNGCI
jgi:hypothetical protein